MSDIAKCVGAACVALGVSTSEAAVCDQVDRFARMVATSAGVVVVVGGGLKEIGIKALPHSSGPKIGAAPNGTYLPRTLGIVGSSIARLTNPTTLAIAGAAVVATGGAVLACNYSGSDR